MNCETLDDFDEQIIDLNRTIRELRAKIKLYEMSTTMDFNKINSQKEYIYRLERQIENVNKENDNLILELQMIKKTVEKFI